MSLVSCDLDTKPVSRPKGGNCLMTGSEFVAQDTAGIGRIESLDFLRGMAVLGMLVANVPWHAGDSMSRVIEPDFWSVSAWFNQYLIFDQRFMPIFCMLFGASIFLLTGTGGVTKAFTGYYLRRMGVLLLLGVAHAYLLWPGDILITYAICGPFLLLFYRAPIGVLIAVGSVLKGIDLVFGEWPQLYFATIDTWLFSWVEIGEAPSSIVAAYAGSYADLFAYNVWRNQFLQWTALPYFRIWNALGFMLIGMALFKTGILQGRKSQQFYKRFATVSLLIGFPLVLYGVLARIGANPTVGPYLGFITELPLQNITFRTGCAAVSFTVLAVIHYVYPHVSRRIQVLVGAVGRMALTNYIFHSIFFLIVFHLIAPDAFDQLDHDVLLLFVLGVWGIQLWGSSLWMTHYKQGPLEAMWRMLAGKKKKMENNTSLQQTSAEMTDGSR